MKIWDKYYECNNCNCKRYSKCTCKKKDKK